MKAPLRKKLRGVLGSLSKEEIHDRSIVAIQRLLDLREYARSEILMTFLSMPKEIDTTSLVLQAWQDGKRVLVPRISWEQRRILAVEIQSFDAVAATPLGIREPTMGPPIPVSYIDLVTVPGLGFDSLGNRIGRGSGFYDRFLGQPDFRGIACAIAFEEQYVDNVPVGPLDRPVDMLVTDKNEYRFEHYRKRGRRRS